MIQEKWKPDLNRLICVKNISAGELIYISKRQLGYQVEWTNPNDTNYMELSELKNLLSSDRFFFKNLWIRIIEDDEIEIYKYLNVYKNYKDFLNLKLDDVDDIFKLSISKFEKAFKLLPEAFQKTIAKNAVNKIIDGTLDSMKIVKVIESITELDLNLMAETKKRADKKINKE